jgi:hypothetical protein
VTGGEALVVEGLGATVDVSVAEARDAFTRGIPDVFS